MFSLCGVWLCSWGQGGAIFPQTALDYVVPQRAGGVWCSPVGVADSLQWSWVQARGVSVGCVHVTQVQYIAESCSV
jgi:hypothetical protein